MKNSVAEIGIIGLGPAGLGAALGLADSPIAHSTLCFEAGVSAEEKYCAILMGSKCREDEPCQMISGVGGCSVLSGGKISDFPAGRALTPLVGGENQLTECLSAALGLFRRYIPLHLAPNSPTSIEECSQRFASLGFKFRYYPAHRYRHSDLVRGCSRMVQRLVASGVAVHLNTEVTQVSRGVDSFIIEARCGPSIRTYRCRRVLIASGRLAGKLMWRLNDTFDLGGVPREFDVGVRLEFPTEIWPDIDECHNDLKLHFGNARTFCVCKDGWIAPYRMNGIILTEGHSELGVRTGLTNLAVTLREKPESVDSSIMDSIRLVFQKQFHAGPIRQPLQQFLMNSSATAIFPRNSSISFWTPGNVNECFPSIIAEKLRCAVSHFVSALIDKSHWEQISILGPELDQYCNRYPLQTGFQTNTQGLYILGDAGGHFRGILQSFCSGLTCVHMLLERLNG